MKKILTILPAAALAFTACTSSNSTGPEDVIANMSSSNENAVSSSSEVAQGASSSSTITTPVKKYPTNYIVVEMGEYALDGNVFTTTMGSCTAEGNQAVWKKVSQTGTMAKNDDGTVKVDFGDGEGEYIFDYKAEGDFPKGDYYLSNMLDSALVFGFSLTTPDQYTAVIYPTTECVIKGFTEMAETFSDIAGLEINNSQVGCNDVTAGDMKLSYVSNDETSIDYKLTYKEYSCDLHHEFLYENSEEDCKLAFANYQEEYEKGETKDLFDFGNYDQDINAKEGSEEACATLFMAYMVDAMGGNMDMLLAKKAPVDAEKQVKKLIRAISPRTLKKK